MISTSVFYVASKYMLEKALGCGLIISVLNTGVGEVFSLKYVIISDSHSRCYQEIKYFAGSNIQLNYPTE